MAILKVARMGHPVLRRRADPVADPTAPAITKLVSDMVETMNDEPGIGLAAPQVHVPLRILVFCVPELRADDPDAEAGTPEAPVPLTVLINPEVEMLGEETTEGWEGCLSVPGLTGRVTRARRIRYRGVSHTGEPIEREADKFHARVVQHEFDHLNGILYPQRMTDLTRLGFVEEIQRYRPPVGATGSE